MKTNMILNTDSYKASHFLQYPKGSKYVSSYIEARGSDDPAFTEMVFFGLQMFIQEYMMNPITMEDVEEARAVFTAHGEPFNADDWIAIVEDYNGFMPVEIRAIPEGTVIPLKNALVQVVNTDERFPWLTSFIETAILRAVWYPSTVATNSYTIKKSIMAAAEKTGDVNGVPFKLHDFGARGVSSKESAGIGGVAHLVNFMGTDTVEALLYARRFYNENMAGYSIPASEHSTITTWGRGGEIDAYRNMVEQFAGEDKIYAVVSDSYDMERAAKSIWGNVLRHEVMTRGGTLVVRPDSGDPTIMPIKVIQWLMDSYGYTINDKGFKVLPDCIRVIQGDGITKDSIQVILDNLETNMLSVDNLGFGMGGGMLQLVNRDTLKFAMKANAIKIHDEWFDVYKEPKTDGGKSSKAGIQAVIREGGTFRTIRADNLGYANDQLRTVYEDGQQFNVQTFADIRARSTGQVEETLLE